VQSFLVHEEVLRSWRKLKAAPTLSLLSILAVIPNVSSRRSHDSIPKHHFISRRWHEQPPMKHSNFIIILITSCRAPGEIIMSFGVMHHPHNPSCPFILPICFSLTSLEQSQGARLLLSLFLSLSFGICLFCSSQRSAIRIELRTVQSRCWHHRSIRVYSTIVHIHKH